jgi:hypothetical protein
LVVATDESRFKVTMAKLVLSKTPNLIECAIISAIK